MNILHLTGYGPDNPDAWFNLLDHLTGDNSKWEEVNEPELTVLLMEYGAILPDGWKDDACDIVFHDDELYTAFMLRFGHAAQ